MGIVFLFIIQEHGN